MKGKAGSRESPGLFSPKSNSTRGCNRSRDAPKDARPVICESRVAAGWYGPIPATWYRAIRASKDFEKPCVRPVALGVRNRVGQRAVTRFRAGGDRERIVWLGKLQISRAGMTTLERYVRIRREALSLDFRLSPFPAYPTHNIQLQAWHLLPNNQTGV